MQRLLLENMADPPEEATPSREPVGAAARLGDIRAPTLVVTGDRDVPAMEQIGDALERGISGARRARLDSDHYLPLREPDAFNALVLDFLTAAAQESQDEQG